MDADAALQSAGLVGPYMGMYFTHPLEWTFAHFLAFGVIMITASEIVARSIPSFFCAADRIPLNPKLHYDRLDAKDVFFIFINKVSIVVFFYHFVYTLASTPSVLWAPREATIMNTFLVLIPFYVVYDFFYVLWHKFLHLRCMYGYIHKHHHRQISPTRGHYDALNVHPVEFVVGEWIHLLVPWLIPCHVFGAALFLVLGTVLATLNHTRLAVAIPGLYDVKNHAVHHRLPDTNMGQYTMFWDKVFGWFETYDDTLAKKP